MTDSDRFEKMSDSELFAMAEGRTGDITAVGPAKAEIERRRVEREIEAETTRRAHATEIAEKQIAAAQRVADKHVRTAGLAATAAVCSALAAVALAVVAAVRLSALEPSIPLSRFLDAGRLAGALDIARRFR